MPARNVHHVLGPNAEEHLPELLLARSPASVELGIKGLLIRRLPRARGVFTAASLELVRRDFRRDP